MRGNRCILRRWVSLLLVLLTSLTFPLFNVYLFLMISLSKLPVHISRWLTFCLYFISRRCSESKFKWKHPRIWLNTWHSLDYFRFECDTCKIAQIIFLLEIVLCNCISITGIISQASYSPVNYIILTQNSDIKLTISYPGVRGVGMWDPWCVSLEKSCSFPLLTRCSCSSRIFWTALIFLGLFCNESLLLVPLKCWFCDCFCGNQGLQCNPHSLCSNTASEIRHYVTCLSEEIHFTRGNEENKLWSTGNEIGPWSCVSIIATRSHGALHRCTRKHKAPSALIIPFLDYRQQHSGKSYTQAFPHILFLFVSTGKWHSYFKQSFTLYSRQSKGMMVPALCSLRQPCNHNPVLW